LAVLYGEKKAAITAVLFFLSAVFLSPIPWLLGSVSFWFLPIVAITDFGLLTSSFMLLKDISKENARKVKNTVLLWFLIGLLSFIVGAL
jgi:geranylgeranylglycerol-phosphate geranylgeranyltransferase